MEEIIVIGITVQELRDLIYRCVQESIQEHLKMEPKEDDSLLIVDEVAKYLGVSKVTIHVWEKEGKLPFHRMGRRVYFKKSEILKGF